MFTSWGVRRLGHIQIVVWNITHVCQFQLFPTFRSVQNRFVETICYFNHISPADSTCRWSYSTIYGTSNQVCLVVTSAATAILPNRHVPAISCCPPYPISGHLAILIARRRCLFKDAGGGAQQHRVIIPPHIVWQPVIYCNVCHASETQTWDSLNSSICPTHYDMNTFEKHNTSHDTSHTLRHRHSITYGIYWDTCSGYCEHVNCSTHPQWLHIHHWVLPFSWTPLYENTHTWHDQSSSASLYNTITS